MLSKVTSFALFGLAGVPISVETDINHGLPAFELVGLADAAVKESKERVRSAIKNSARKFPDRKITVNLAPADIKKEGAFLDLPIAIGLLKASEQLVGAETDGIVFWGELALDGALRPVNGVLPLLISARDKGYTKFILPRANAEEAAYIGGTQVFAANNLIEVIDHLSDLAPIAPVAHKTYSPHAAARESVFDMAYVKGQPAAKRAVEIAVAGSHNILLIGPPGTGKTMLARCLPTIMPDMTFEEALEVTKIHSVAGKMERGSSLLSQRPFRAPHHTISSVALVGGGAFPQPGEISLAHNGVLFLDELPEFSRQVLEVMRQPLEDRKITISRAKYSIEYPASLMLVASMNPCPCGYYNHPEKKCICPPGSVLKYLNRISGPLLDRIDIQIEIVPVPFEKMADSRPGEPSAVIRERVIRARDIQAERFKDIPGVYCNAQMNTKLLNRFAQPDELGKERLKDAMKRFGLSARAYDRILKVARTIADLAGSENVLSVHIAEAINYRNLDRENWAG